MTKSSFIQLQAVRLAQTAPLDSGAWILCKKGRLGIGSSERHWAELRGDVILLYPAREIEHQLHMYLLLRRPNEQIKPNLQEILERKRYALSPKAYTSFVRSFSSRVPQSKIIPVLFRISNPQVCPETQEIRFRAYNQSAAFPPKALSLTFDSAEAMQPWKEAVERIPELYEKTLSDFSLVRHIGSGGTGNVFLVRDRFSHKKIAMKAIEKESFSYEDSIRRLVDERIVYSRMRKHPYILEMSHAYETRERMYVATEYCSRGDLFRQTGRHGGVLPEEIAKKVAAEVLLALESLHDQGIWYRDLKPENIMVADSGHVKLGDFGTAKIINPIGPRIPRASSTIGTAEYLAPEVVRGESYNRTVDLWAFGIFICEIMNGVTPFQGFSREETYDRIEYEPLALPITMPEDARNLVRALLKHVPSQRLGSGLSGWQDIKSHPWFHGIEWGEMYRPNVSGPFPSILAEREETEQNTAIGERKRVAIENFAEDLKRDYEYVAAVRYNHDTGTATRVPKHPLWSKLSLSRVIGVYGWGERRKSNSLMSLEPQEPLSIPDVKNGDTSYVTWSPNGGAQWQPSTKHPAFGTEEEPETTLKGSLWRKLSSGLKFFRIW